MTPTKIMNNPINTYPTKFNLGGDLSNGASIFEKASHLNNLPFGRLCSMILLALGCAIFFSTVLHVLLLRTQEKMRWITAGRVIATVKHAFSFWDCAISDLVGHAMGKLKLLFKRKLPVAFVVNASSPYPAGFMSVGFIQQRPESFWSIFTGSFLFHSKKAASRIGSKARIMIVAATNSTGGNRGFINFYLAALKPQV